MITIAIPRLSTTFFTIAIFSQIDKKLMFKYGSRIIFWLGKNGLLSLTFLGLIYGFLSTELSEWLLSIKKHLKEPLVPPIYTASVVGNAFLTKNVFLVSSNLNQEIKPLFKGHQEDLKAAQRKMR